MNCILEIYKKLDAVNSCQSILDIELTTVEFKVFKNIGVFTGVAVNRKEVICTDDDIELMRIMDIVFDDIWQDIIVWFEQRLEDNYLDEHEIALIKTEIKNNYHLSGEV